MNELAQPYRDPVFNLELGQRVIEELMTQEDWDFLLDRLFLSELETPEIKLSKYS